jgi:AAA ATPase domain
VRPNPFNPASIITEEYFVGRQVQLDKVDVLINQFDSGFSHSPLAFLAPAGFGKTTLLKHVSTKLRRQSWMCGYVEASTDTATAMQDVLTDIRRSLPTRRSLKRVLKSINSFNATMGVVGFGVGVKATSYEGNYSRLVELLEQLVRIAERDGSGLALLIDEAQVLTQDDFYLIIRAIDHLEGRPIAVIFGGLPNLPDVVEHGANSSPYLDYSYLSVLTPAESKRMLTGVISTVGGQFDAASLGVMVNFCSGYPLVLQIAGSNAWALAQQDAESAEQNVTVRSRHAHLAVARTKAILERSHYRPIWRKCTNSERSMLAWIANSPDSSMQYNAIIERAGKQLEDDADNTYFGLLGKGIIFGDHAGSWEWDYYGELPSPPIRLTLPGFSEFIRRLSTDLT